MSQNHTSTLFITCLLQKWNFAVTLRKNWSGQNQSSQTDSTGPIIILIIIIITSTSDLQPSTAISNPSPGKSVLNKFKP